MFPLKMVIFHSYVSLPGGMCKKKNMAPWPHGPMASPSSPSEPQRLGFDSAWCCWKSPCWLQPGGNPKADLTKCLKPLEISTNSDIWRYENLWNLWNIDHYDCYILLHWFRYVSIMRWIFQRFFRPFSIHKTAPQAVTWALMTPASLTASMGPQIVQVIRWVSSFSIEIYGDFGDPPSLTLWLFNIAMENGPVIDGLPIKNGDFPWLC